MKKNKRTLARKIPGLEPGQGGERGRGNVGKERSTVNVGGEGFRNRLMTP